MSKPTTTTTDDNKNIPAEFTKIIYDLINDILTTFPEYMENMDADLSNIKETQDQDSIEEIYTYVKNIIPERFFDILYKNEKMFVDDSINTKFLPGIDFKDIWKSDISDATKETIWKYLQLILFTIIGKVDSHESFGDTAKLFESINEDELKHKLEDTLSSLQGMLNSDSSSGPIDVSGTDYLPNPEQIQDHLNGILDGKLGKLAKEIAEETAADLNFDMEGATTVNDVFQKLFKNPGKLMNLVKSVGGKLDDKIKSGEINESEIMAEASGLLGKMKDMPGMGDIQSMLKKMGMGSGGAGGGLGGLAGLAGLGGLGGLGGLAGLGGGKNSKLNLGAMQNMLDQNIKLADKKEKMKERMNEKLTKKKQEYQLEQDRLQNLPPTSQLTEHELEQLVFSIEGEKPEKSMRSDNSNKKKKKVKNK